ncbi:MAG: DUF4085 family protein [Solirubrobacterales bacterium]
MKYFTKDFYQLFDYVPYLLEEEKQAECFSEEYFLKLYSEKVEEMLKAMEQLPSHLRDYKPFDRDKEAKNFYDYINDHKKIKNILPNYILREIADLRVFMLGKASRNVVNALYQLHEEKEKYSQNVAEEYRTYYKQASKLFLPEIVENLHFHDCFIKEINKNENELKILFDNSGSQSPIEQVIFENYKIIKCEDLLENSWWIYEEIYKSNDIYELHVLLQKKDMKLIEFIISFENIKFHKKM